MNKATEMKEVVRRETANEGDGEGEKAKVKVIMQEVEIQETTKMKSKVKRRRCRIKYSRQAKMTGGGDPWKPKPNLSQTNPEKRRRNNQEHHQNEIRETT